MLPIRWSSFSAYAWWLSSSGDTGEMCLIHDLPVVAPGTEQCGREASAGERPGAAQIVEAPRRITRHRLECCCFATSPQRLGRVADGRGGYGGKPRFPSVRNSSPYEAAGRSPRGRESVPVGRPDFKPGRGRRRSCVGSTPTLFRHFHGAPLTNTSRPRAAHEAAPCA